MLEEKELKSMHIPNQISGGKEFDVGTGAASMPQRAECGLRHMSTLAASVSSGKAVPLKLNPMW